MRSHTRGNDPTLAVSAKPRGPRIAAFVHNLHRYSAPSSGAYDALFTPVLGPFYERVARRVAALQPGGRVLEVGPGPGHLAVRLARLAPNLRIVGLDVSPDMARRARRRAINKRVADQVRMQVGDVAALPFPDGTFDLAVSTFSLHHWEDAAVGLAEIHRVLRPGGTLLLYDVEDWVSRWERAGPALAELAPMSPFHDRGTWSRQSVLRVGPLSIVYRAELRRAELPASP